MTGKGLKLEVPSQTGDVRQSSLHFLGNLVHSFDDLEVIDEGDITHQDLRDGRNGGRVVGYGSLVDLVKQLGLHLEEGLQRGMFACRNSIDQPEENLTLALVWQEILNSETSIGLVPSGVVCELLELGQNIVALALRDDDKTAVHLLTVLKGGEFDISNDTEVVAATLQGLEEVGMLLLVGVDNFARGQDDLEANDSVGDETTLP